MGEEKTRWGILGPGIIAHRFADALHHHPDCELMAVASRTPGKAAAFAEEHAAEAAEDYETLVADSRIDVVYVATTHNFHAENARLALSHDKHVVIEKPITVNAREARELAELARARGLFLMEAMWTRFLPSIRAMKAALKEGAIGEVLHLQAAFGGFVPDHYRNRLSSPELAGGVTLDMGCYPISFACHLLDALPSEVQSMARMSETGVDELAIYQFRFPDGRTAAITASYDLKLQSEAAIYGTRGFIEFPDFPAGESFVIHRHDGTNEIVESTTISKSGHANGFYHQIDEVVRCLEAGETESPLMPAGESVALMELMDDMRADWGLVYPFEASTRNP
ncbi:MAG: Gfo/Idh/MocA family oxidoreductase [Xanthomonadales bacterium]|nr:Gfo/Idh/MocA family oxidoreductase [Xanthomonadales bacterium]